ncbi:hypothetical protein [Anatilimnocola aggregata]|uniref:hypothetical protein n=1 Tax=Anatilimnocola aggregata TaxID=2528021 RepID=UPI0011A9EC4F|nr:hypothetical protein [Anatilimnocola aggregata]
MVYRKHIVRGTGFPQSLCASLLTAEKAETSIHRGQVKMKPVTETYYERTKGGEVTLPAGLGDRLVEALEREGYTVQQFNKTEWPVLRSAWRLLQNSKAELESEEVARRSLFATLPRTQFKVANTDQAASLLVSATSTHPTVTIHVIANNPRTASDLVKGLKRRGTTKLHGPDSTENWRKGDIIVNTPPYLQSEVTRNSGMVAFVGAEVFRSEQVLSNLDLLNDVMRCGILIGEKSISAREQLTIEGLVGRMIPIEP